MPPAATALALPSTAQHGVASARPLRPRQRLSAALEARRRDAVADALLRALDLGDPVTARHCRAVAGFAELIGDDLGLAPNRLRDLRRAAVMHDIGKASVPIELLHGRAPLNGAEQRVMRLHAEEGEHMLREAGLDREATWVRHHHERLDGGGYPDALAAAEVPLESRVIFVADAFEAMIADRSYRRGRPAEAALAELDLHAGTQFDPACVAALHRTHDAERAVRRGRFAAAEAGRPRRFTGRLSLVRS